MLLETRIGVLLLLQGWGLQVALQGLAGSSQVLKLGPLAVAQCVFQSLGAGIVCGPGPKGPGETASYLASCFDGANHSKVLPCGSIVLLAVTRIGFLIYFSCAHSDFLWSELLLSCFLPRHE